MCVHVCASVREDISGTTRAMFIKFLCVSSMTVAWSSFGRVTKSQGKRTRLLVFFPIDNAMYSIAFGTHTKTDEPIKMLLGMLTGLGPRNNVTWGDDPRRSRNNLEEHVPDKPNTPNNCKLN